MANLAITNYCNLKCKYCFADDMVHEEKYNMSLNEIEKMLFFIGKTNESVGIIGGEPTLHPQFSKIIDIFKNYTQSRGCKATLFTNGLNLSQYLDKLDKSLFGILFNINHPDSMTPSQWEITNQVLEELNEKHFFPDHCTIGCNLYPEYSDYSYIWEIVDKYSLPCVRTSVTSPGGCLKHYREDKEAYFNTMKPIFIKHCEEAKKRDVKLNLDCSNIPECYFSDDELILRKEACNRELLAKICTPVVDITSFNRATACFGAYDPIDISEFEDMDEVRNYLLYKKVFPKQERNNQGKCSTCKKHELLQCQGGCLGFVD